MNDFRLAIDDCGLMDLGHDGDPFTWQRGRSTENLIRERLDRFMATMTWCNIYHDWCVVHFPRTNSDHSLIVLDTDGISSRIQFKPRRCSFKFEPMWVTNPECEIIVH
ncbi:hypothetical protein RND81_12G073000 [Saponaria officinalis]|uniref:Reverse transcriptase n=1 Tax=Saponaria officinalis TaxID=3572 RepID=A0AAW1H7N0_SAPOF